MLTSAAKSSLTSGPTTPGCEKEINDFKGQVFLRCYGREEGEEEDSLGGLELEASENMEIDDSINWKLLFLHADIAWC